jgi:hypothetical protein
MSLLRTLSLSFIVPVPSSPRSLLVLVIVVSNRLKVAGEALGLFLKRQLSVMGFGGSVVGEFVRQFLLSPAKLVMEDETSDVAGEHFVRADRVIVS